MENAKILLIQKVYEDLPILRDSLKLHGNKIIKETHTLNGSLRALKLIKLGKLAVPDMVILDGNLTIGDRQCEEAKIIIATTKIYGLSPLIVGFSEIFLTENGINTPDMINVQEHHDIGRNHTSLLRIIDVEL